MSLDLYTEKSPEIIIVFSLWKGLNVSCFCISDLRLRPRTYSGWAPGG